MATENVDDAMAVAARLLLRELDPGQPAQPPANSADPGPGPILGLIRDDAELMDEIAADAYRKRRGDTWRNPHTQRSRQPNSNESGGRACTVPLGPSGSSVAEGKVFGPAPSTPDNSPCLRLTLSPPRLRDAAGLFGR